MLARIAENLYWIGRNLERCEHCARYMQVQYFSTLEAPMSQNKDFTLRSILFMSGGNFQNQGILDENQVWQKVIFDNYNPNSLVSLVKNIRENARSIRNTISEEFWEAINKWYLDYCQINQQQFSSEKIFEFSKNMELNIVLIKSRLHHTFLHDDVWGFICLGIYLERTLQVLRIIRSKISDSTILSNNGENQAILEYQWTTLLMCLEAFGVYKKEYRGVKSKKSILDLLINNDLFPRSLTYASSKIRRHLHGISVLPYGHQTLKDNFEKIHKDCLSFKVSSDESAIIHQLDQAYNCLAAFHKEIEQLYFQH